VLNFSQAHRVIQGSLNHLLHISSCFNRCFSYFLNLLISWVSRWWSHMLWTPIAPHILQSPHQSNINFSSWLGFFLRFLSRLPSQTPLLCNELISLLNHTLPWNSSISLFRSRINFSRHQSIVTLGLILIQSPAMVVESLETLIVILLIKQMQDEILPVHTLWGLLEAGGQNWLWVDHLMPHLARRWTLVFNVDSCQVLIVANWVFH